MTTLAQDLGGVVRLLEKATPGEWFARRGYRYMHVRAKGDKFGDPYIMEARQRGTVRLDDDAKAIAAAVNFLRAHSAEIAGALRDAERWRPIESAPTQGVIELAVVSGKGAERKTMVAERSFRDGEPYWIVTHGWVGWNTLHPGWTPYAWRPLPAPPAQDSAMQQGGGGGGE